MSDLNRMLRQESWELQELNYQCWLKELTGGLQYGLISQRIHKIITFLELEKFNSKEDALLAILSDLEGNMSSEKLVGAANIAKALFQEKHKLVQERESYFVKRKFY